MKTTFMIRQGDVLVFAAEPPKDSSVVWARQPRDEKKRVVLAAGEMTGHHHAIRNRNVCLLRAEGVSDAVLTIGAKIAELVHEEHGTVAIPRGEYRVRIQREWSGALSRRVED